MGPGATQSVRGIYQSFTETNLTVVEGLHQRIMCILQVGLQVKRGRGVRRGVRGIMQYIARLVVCVHRVNYFMRHAQYCLVRVRSQPILPTQIGTALKQPYNAHGLT